MGRDSHSKGRGFESRHHILDGHFFTYICCKNCDVCLERPKINEKEAGVGPFKNIALSFSASPHVVADLRIYLNVNRTVANSNHSLSANILNFIALY